MFKKKGFRNKFGSALKILESQFPMLCTCVERALSYLCQSINGKSYLWKISGMATMLGRTKINLLK